MKITNRIVDSNDSTVGYLIDDGSFIRPECKKALYNEMFITALIAEGYKYYSYDADTIEDPTGMPIAQLPAVSRYDADKVDDVGFFASVTNADIDAMSDAAASKYYTFREASAVKFKEEDSYEINSREDFIAYLKGIERNLYEVNFSTDNRPINAFVNPEALFTVDEIEKDQEVRKLFNIIIKRHRFRNYASYMDLVRWLMQKGVLNTETPTTAEFLNAYYAWGPEGIKDSCVDYKLKLNVDGIFEFMSDTLFSNDPMTYMTANRSHKVSVIDGNDNIHFLRESQSTSEITDAADFQRSRLSLISNETLLSLRRRTGNGRKYLAVGKTLVSDVSDRVYFNVITESGYAYTYKVAHNKLKIGLTHTNTTSEVYSTSINFGFATIAQDVVIPLDYIRNENDYYLWNLAILKSAQLIQKKSKKAPVSGTAEFLRNDGVNPVAVINMMAHSICKNPNFNSNGRYNFKDRGYDMLDALNTYLQPIPEAILNAYKLSLEDLTEGMTTFLDLADVDDLADRRLDMANNRIMPGDAGYDTTFIDESTALGKKEADRRAASNAVTSTKNFDAIDYYHMMRFVHDCIHGNLAINNFGDGILEDMGASYMISAECILSVIYAEFGNNPDLGSAEQAILDMENGNLIDINNIFRMRDNAWKGYMMDFAEYRRLRADKNTWVWAYCTKVFRELSNAPIEKQRPYLMELVVLENNKIDLPARQLMTTCVADAISKLNLDDTRFAEEGKYAYNWSEAKVAMESADFVAAKLFFYILAGGVKTQPIDGMYKIPMQVQEGIDTVIDVPVPVYDFVKGFNTAAHKRYITVYDFCAYEYNVNTKEGTFSLYLVNADVDPWHVKPKTGYNIKSYPLMPNYQESTALDNANGEGFYLQAKNTGSICVTPLKQSYRSLFIPQPVITDGYDEVYMNEQLVKGAQSYTDMEDFLLPSQQEFIFAYIKRWTLAKRAAAANNCKLVSMPLKQDIVYHELAGNYCAEIPSMELVMSKDVTVDDRAFATDTNIKLHSWKDNVEGIALLSNKGTVIKQMAVDDLSVDAIDSQKVILGGQTFCPVPVFVSGNYLVIKSDGFMRVPVSRITPEQLAQFEADGILYNIGGGKYYIHAVNGGYILEVNQ